MVNKIMSHKWWVINNAFIARAATHENWCVDWWLDEMYLRQRVPLPVNSSPGMIVHRNNSRSKSENAAFIAEIIKLVIKYKSHVENNELNEQSTGQLAGSHLCMAQVRIQGQYDVNTGSNGVNMKWMKCGFENWFKSQFVSVESMRTSDLTSFFL